jgi:ATP-dependent Lhr-like helicase
MEHPIVRQTIEDCLTEAMDVDGFLEVLAGLRDGRIEKRAVDTAEPSAFARAILAARPYSFLDDAPLEERRTQAVLSRRVLDIRTADELGALDRDAIERVREEAWPRPQSAEEVHEALLWMGYATADEAADWAEWVDELVAAGRVLPESGRLFAAEATRDPLAVLRGRLEALGPVEAPSPSLPEDAPALLPALEAQGAVLRTRIDGREAWCDRRLLARIQRYTLDRLRREIEPATASQFLRFLACWQHVDPDHALEGPRGVAEAIRQLAGFEVMAAAWEGSVLPARVRGYQREWLDQVTLSGEAAWMRLWGAAASGPLRRAPMALVPREDLSSWLALSALSGPSPEPPAGARGVEELLRARGALFHPELARAASLPPAELDQTLAELVGLGRATCDSFAGLRFLMVPTWRRSGSGATAGRWSVVPRVAAPASPTASPELAEFVARQLLRRTGVVFRRTLGREKQPVPWRDLVRVCRRLEARGEIRGGRFVAGFEGEQYALPEAITLLRDVRRRGDVRTPASVAAADPLNFRGILTPDERISPATRRLVQVG